MLACMALINRVSFERVRGVICKALRYYLGRIEFGQVLTVIVETLRARRFALIPVAVPTRRPLQPDRPFGRAGFVCNPPPGHLHR